MAGDDWMDAYIAEALESTGTRKTATPRAKPESPKQLATAPARSPNAQPHSVVPRTPPQPRTAMFTTRMTVVVDSPIDSIDRARKPLPPPPPAIARTASPLVIARMRDLDAFDEDTQPDTGSHSLLTDHDERGVRRS